MAQNLVYLLLVTNINGKSFSVLRGRGHTPLPLAVVSPPPPPPPPSENPAGYRTEVVQFLSQYLLLYVSAANKLQNSYEIYRHHDRSHNPLMRMRARGRWVEACSCRQQGDLNYFNSNGATSWLSLRAMWSQL